MSYISFLLFVFVASFTPGPNNIMAMAFANHYGLRKTLPFSFGVGFGFFVITLTCITFNLFLINLLPAIQLPLTILGVVYMLYLAFKILTSKDGESNNPKKDRNLFFIGTLLQFVNPKGILYGMAVVSTFISPYYTSLFSYITASLFLGLVGVASTFCWSLGGSIFQHYIQQYRKPFNILMAILLVYSAFSIVWS